MVCAYVPKPDGFPACEISELKDQIMGGGLDAERAFWAATTVQVFLGNLIFGHPSDPVQPIGLAAPGTPRITQFPDDQCDQLYALADTIETQQRVAGTANPKADAAEFDFTVLLPLILQLIQMIRNRRKAT